MKLKALSGTQSLGC